MRWLFRGAALSLLTAPALGAGCAEETIEVDVRSLDRSGRVSFVCLDDPAQGAAAARPVGDCRNALTPTADDYAVPHLYAVVTQLTRGEVAVIDLTTQSDVDDVLDQNARVPGSNFLPVGAQPVDIVSSPGSTATYVAVAEVGRRGIFAIPSAQLRPQGRAEQPTLSSWPACSLGSYTPGSMLMVADPPDAAGGVRQSCDGAYGPPGDGPAGNPDFSSRPKLLVTIPDEAAIAVIDAHSLAARAPGSFEACEIERWVPLTVQAGTVPAPETFPVQAGCVNPETPTPDPVGTTSRPAGMAVAGDRLYVADLEAPVIHVLDMPSPCDLVEREPLLPGSMLEPERVVTTSRLAAMVGTTTDFKRYLYAIDADEGGVMAFDISDEGAAPRTPLRRPNPEVNPFLAPDRAWLSGSPAVDVVMIQRDIAVEDANGVAQTGIQCDPDSADTLGAKYQTDSSYDFGAQPTKLRGTFGFILLAGGAIGITDVEDFDAPCRKPRQPLGILGCTEEEIGTSLPYASNESTCNVVIPNTPRVNDFFTWADDAQAAEPGLQSFPRLTDGTGKAIGDQDIDRPRMRALIPQREGDRVGFDQKNTGFGLTVATDRVTIDPTNGLVILEDAPTELHDTLAMNLYDPHVHSAQQWSVVFEGPLPGFNGRFGELRIGSAFPADEGLYDANSRFCDRGVLGYNAVLEMVSEGQTEAEAQQLAATLADRLVIASELPSEASPHWEVAACSYQACTATFGTPDVPTPARDLPIIEAYQDHVSLAPSVEEDVTNELVKCCFPGVISFQVRPSQQWVVSGDGSGFLHRVIEDPVTGACRNSCDPRLALANGRVRTVSADADVADADFFVDKDPSWFMQPQGKDYATVLVNPAFRFAVTRCHKAPEGQPDVVCELGAIGRNTFFQWETNPSYEALAIDLSEDLTILPQSLSLNGPSGVFAVTDGSLQGLILVDPGAVAERRTYY